MGGRYGVGEPRFGPNSLNSWVKLWINTLNYVIPLKESTPPSKYVQPKNIPKISIKAPMNTVPKTIETPLNCVRLMLRTPSVLRCSTAFRNEIELLRCVGKGINALVKGLPYDDWWSISLLIKAEYMHSNLRRITCLGITFNYGYIHSSYITLKTHWIGPVLIIRKKETTLIYVPEAHLGFREKPKLILINIPSINEEVALIPTYPLVRVIPTRLNITLRPKHTSLGNVKSWYIRKSITYRKISMTIKYLLAKGLVRNKTIALLDICLQGALPKKLLTSTAIAIINIKLENGTLIKLYEPINIKSIKSLTHAYTCYVISDEVPQALMNGGTYETYIEPLNTLVRVVIEATGCEQYITRIN